MRKLALVALTVGAVMLPGAAAAETHGLVFTSALKLDFDAHEKGGIFFVRADGSSPRKITNFQTLNYAFKLHGLDLPDDHPSCSPDGRRIAFTSSRAAPGGIGAPNDFQIYTMNPNGSGLTQLTNVPGRNIVPTFSPDGSRIAFASERAGGVMHVFTMKADGSDVRQITSGPDPDSEPAWSPDGTKIAFTRIPFSALGLGFTQKDVWIVGADGTGLRQLTDTTGEDHDPSFSPDGSRIAYSSERTVIPSPPFGDTFVIDVVKGTTDPGLNLTSDLAFGAGDPAWHPDGSRIAFFKATLPVLTSPMQIWTMSPSGANKVHVTHLLTDGILNVHPAWCKLADTDQDGRPDYLENQNVSLGQAALRDSSAFASSRLGGAVAYADLTHDGRPDLALAMPDDPVAGEPRAGRVMLVRGSSLGPDLDDAGGLPSAVSPPTFGANAVPNGRFGAALASCDFDGDGFTDLAIGAPGQDRVFVMLAKSGRAQTLAGSGDFGAALAAGDFDADGRCDLAVGAPTEARPAGARPVAAGAVRVFYGTASGLGGTPQIIDQGAVPVPADVGRAQAGDRFGAALAAGKIGSDAALELVIGAPGENVLGLADAGIVHVVPGVVGGRLAVASAIAIDARALPLPHGPQAGGSFGEALAVGKLSPTLGPFELVVGAPHHDVGGVVDAGLVATFASSSLLTSPSFPATGKVLTAASFGQVAEAGAELGHALAVGDASGDAIGDLAVSAPGQSAAGKSAAGAVYLVMGGPASNAGCAFCGPGTAALGGGLQPATAVKITQSAVGDVEEVGDRFGGGGQTLAFADLDGDGQSDLLVGTPSETTSLSHDGLVSLRYGLRVGVSQLSPTALGVAPGDRAVLRLDWRHPIRWRALDTLHVRIANDDGVALWVRFREDGDALWLGVEDAQGRVVEGRPGDAAVLRGPAGALDLAASKVTGTGADGPSVTLELAVSFDEIAAGRDLRVELLATDDLGHAQGFEPAGRVSVGTALGAGGGCSTAGAAGQGVGLAAVILVPLVLARRRSRRVVSNARGR